MNNPLGFILVPVLDVQELVLNQIELERQCIKYRVNCCGKCNGCVPWGPYADKAQCPCYRDLKNPKGKDKCS
ncbi:Gibberellin regulated protein [Artemisia annua]|uniref:Gibberellin regulated protein n=1 Tax=Artemisia annua TaxID=35608 RepID=A0A2U1Q252_ARTAN|nr:Gibberellin regulated protein [Artemisia annua]